MSLILLLSEQQHLCDILKEALRPHGIQIDMVAQPETFLARCRELQPVMVIIDNAVASGAGLRALQMLRGAEDVIAKLPVIIAEETGDLVVISEALKYGIADYFVSSRLDHSGIVQKIFKNLPKDSGVIVPKEYIQQGQQKYVILLVEDDRFLRDLTLQKFTQEKNMNVITAVDGEQGVTLAEKHIPHIILLDAILPGIDGFEVLKRLRSKPQFARTVIVMLSNFGQREDMDKAMALGANQFLVKANYTLDEIVAEVKRLLEI